MVGIFIDDEVRALMNKAARDERSANIFAAGIMVLLVIGVVAALLWAVWHFQPEVDELPPVPLHETTTPTKPAPSIQVELLVSVT